MICIRGNTVRDAHYIVAPDGRARLIVELRAGTDEQHYATARAVLLIGQGHAAQAAAASAAHHLRKGQRVTVYGEGLTVGNGHLIVHGCSAVQPDSAAARRHLEGADA